MPLLRRWGWAAFGTVMLALGFSSAARVPIVGDDFQALQEAFSFGRGDLGTTVVYGWEAGMKAGHFNPVGQLLGAVYHFAAYGLSVVFDADPQVFHALAGFVLMWLVTLAASFALVWTGRFVRNRDVLPFWRVFALVASITAVTVQLHPWSNDPVTTYSMAGLGSAAIAFLLVALALRAMTEGTSGWFGPVSVAVLGVFAVTYYEMLVAAVAATAVVYVGTIVPKSERTHARVRRVVVLLCSGVVLPAIVFIGGRLIAAPAATSGYTGTSVSLSPEAFRTLAYSMVSTIPGGAWPYSLRRIDPMELSRPAIVVAGLLCIGILALAIIWWRSTPLRLTPSKRLWIPAAGLLTLWVLSVASHAFTPKYIAEITAPGLVYLFYAVGLFCAAVGLAAGVLMFSRGRLRTVSVIALPLLCLFALMQQSINWTISDVMREAYSGNAQLAALSTDEGTTEAERCAALDSWTARPWPDYYRDSVETNIDKNYRRVFDEPFCDISFPSQ